GEPLSEVLRREGPFSPDRAARLVCRLTSALEQAHSRDILHRDLKPSNVILREDGEPVLTDFGLARHITLEETGLSRAGALVGTPAYMSPEQVGGGPGELGPASDIWALGVMLYELLTGRLPFEGPSHVILGGILAGEPQPLRQLRPGLSKRLEAICLKAIAR